MAEARTGLRRAADRPATDTASAPARLRRRSRITVSRATAADRGSSDEQAGQGGQHDRDGSGAHGRSARSAIASVQPTPAATSSVPTSRHSLSRLAS